MNKKAILLVLTLCFSLFSILSFIHSSKAGLANFGYTTAGSSWSGTIEETLTGSIFYTYLNGSVQNITAYIYKPSAFSLNATAQIYFSNLTLMGNSSQVTMTHSGGQWITFNFSTHYNLTAGEEYILNVWTDETDNYAYLAYDSGVTDQGYVDGATYDDPPDPLVPDNNNRKHSIYCTLEEVYEYNYYFYGLYDENTGLLEDAGSRAVNVTAYWSDGTAPSTFEVNGTSYQVFDTSPEYFFFELGSVDREYWLSAAEGDQESSVIYIFNASLTSYTLTFRDWTGALATYSWVSALRSINGTDMVVDKRKVDEQSKVVMGLEAYKKYVIVAEATAGTTYTWGDLTMTSDTSVTLIVKGTEFPQDVILTYRYVRAWANRTYNNSTHDSIYVLYEDTQEATTSVNITIYYGNDTTAHTYEYSDTDSFTYDWDGAENETSYYAIVTVVHATYGTMVFRQSFLGRFVDSPFNLDFLGALPGNIPMSTVLPALILLIVTLGFSALTAGIGGIVVVGVAALMSIMGWWTIDANLLVFAGILAIIYAVLKNYNRVTVR